MPRVSPLTHEAMTYQCFKMAGRNSECLVHWCQQEWYSKGLVRYRLFLAMHGEVRASPRKIQSRSIRLVTTAICWAGRGWHCQCEHVSHQASGAVDLIDR